MPEYRQFAYCNVLGLYCSQINNLISTGSNSLWHCTLLMDPPATVLLQLFVMAAIKGYSSCWHFWGSEPSALKPAKCTEETCLPCASFKHSPGHTSLFAWFTAVWRSVSNLHESSSWWRTLFCLFPLLFEDLCAPRNTHRNCDPGEFFPLAPLGIKRRLREGLLYLSFIIHLQKDLPQSVSI